MKRTIKTADLLAYLDREIKAYETAAEKYCVQLEAIEKGTYKGHIPADISHNRLTKNWEMAEDRIRTLCGVKQHIVYSMAKEGY